MKRREDALLDWEAAKPGRFGKTYYRAFTLAFLIVGFFTLLVFPLSGRSLLWNTDGLEQYYPYFIYEGDWLRSIFASIFSGQGVQVTLWEWSMGYGADVIATLDVFMDPINLLSAFAPGASSEYMYQFTVVLRMYLAGIAFSAYALYRGHGRFATLCGSLAYSLCITSLMMTQWPGGGMPLIMFPMLLLGAEKVFDRRSPYLFIAASFLFVLVSYYFAYMAFPLLAVYCIIRMVQKEQHVTPRIFITWVLKFVGYMAVGVTLAGLVLVPEMVSLLGMDRVTASSVIVNPLYSLTYYQQVYAGFIGSASVGSDCYIGYGAVALVALLVLFMGRRQNTALKVIFLALTAILLIPMAGSATNGFNYATNRWVWAYAFCVCYIIVVAVPIMLDFGRRQVVFVLTGSIIYALILLLLPAARTEAGVASLAMLMLLLMVLFYQGLSPATRRYALIACIGCAIVCSAFYAISPDEGGWGKSSTPIGSMYKKVTTQSPDILAARVDDSSFWRYDADPASTGANGGSYVRPRNDSVVLGLNGIDYYYSFYNNNVDRFHTELAMANDQVNFSYSNLDGRSMLEAICNVKYYLMPDDGAETSAYNYDDRDNIVQSGKVRGGKNVLYRGSNTLPLGFTYSSWVSRDAYDAMTPIQRQQALLQGAVVDSSSLPETTVETNDQTVPYTVESMQGLTYENGKVTVSSANATLTLRLDGALEDSETYVYVENFDFKSLSPLGLTSQKSLDAMAWYQKAYLIKQDLEWVGPKEYRVGIASDNGSAYRGFVSFVKDYHMYGGKNTWLVNLGYSEDAQHTVTITFPSTGAYTFDNLQVICQPMNQVNGQIDALKQDVMENTSIGTNEFSGTIDLDESKLLYFSVPYSDGWTAYVDGVETPIKKANTAFMALELSPGHHDIEFRYMTPGLSHGALISLVGLVALAAVIVWRKKRHPKKA